MKTGLIKTFLTALAGSVALMVALVLMNNMQPTTVVEASPAVASPALAASELTSMTLTIMPENAKFGDKVEAVITRTSEAAMHSYTATMMVNGMTTPITWELKADESTDPKTICDGRNPGTYYVTATVYQTGTMVGEIYDNVTIAPLIKWDSSVRTMKAPLRLGEVLSAAVKIQPEVNYISDTNEVVEYDFDGDEKVDAGVTITGTNSYTKSTATNATYVWTENLYTKATTYTVNAQYNSGIYGKPTYWATTVVTVVNPDLDLMVHSMDDHTQNITKGMSGDPVNLGAMMKDASKALTETSSVSVELQVGDEIIATLPMTTGEASTVYTLTNETTAPITVPMKATLVSDKFGKDENGKKIIVATKPMSVVVDPKPIVDPCPVSVALAATPDSPIKVGETYTATATVSEQVAETCKAMGVADKDVAFTSNLGTLDPASAATNASGVATTTLKSEVTTGTATLIATVGEVTATVDLVFEPGAEERTLIKEGGGETPLGDGDDDITIEIPEGDTENDVYVEEYTPNVTDDTEVGEKPSTDRAKSRMRTILSYIKLVLKNADGSTYKGKFILKYKVGIGAPALAATVATTQTQLLGASVQQTNGWDAVEASNVTVSGTTAEVTVNVPSASETGYYGRVLINKTVYLPMVPKS